MSKFYLDQIFKEGAKHISKSQKALRYLASRGVSEDQITDLNLGYIPEDEWPPYIDPKKATEEELHYWKQSGKGVKLKGKLLFPMTNAIGIKKALQIRTPDPKIKDYWKLYTLRADIDALFFGTNVAMPHIWETREVYLVEGIFDLFPMQRVFPNTLCCGTATLNPEQITFLKRYVDRVHIMFDHDEQGEKFFNKFYREYRRDFDIIEKVSYGGSDPSDSWERLGEESFRQQFGSELFYSLNSSNRAGPLFG